MIRLGRFDELGSGITNISKYLPLYTKAAKPEFKETLHGFELPVSPSVVPADPDGWHATTP
jgi:predicted HTH transcriptional regulator